MIETAKTAKAIHYVKVEPNISSVLGLGHYVEWALHPKFVGSGDFIFYLERSPSVSGPYYRVAEVVNQLYSYDDTGEIGYKAELDYYYQVRLKLVNGTDEKWFLSDPVPANTYWWEKRDYLVSKEIIRRELLRMKKNSGNLGYLLKRKTFGTKCSRCLDKATGDVTDSSCPVCFGTGFSGGYYAPVEFWVEFGEQQVMRKVSEQGMINNVASRSRVVGFPAVEPNDVWLNKMTGQFHRFGSTIANVANIRNIPIIKSVELSLVSSDDILYSYGNPKEISENARCLK